MMNHDDEVMHFPVDVLFPFYYSYYKMFRCFSTFYSYLVFHFR